LQAAYRPVTRRNCIEIRRLNAYVWNAKPVPVWDVDTVRDYATVNGQTAHGGSLDGPGPVIAGGIVYVSSGTLSSEECRETFCWRFQLTENSGVS
jgi:hypothetical protein